MNMTILNCVMCGIVVASMVFLIVVIVKLAIVENHLEELRNKHNALAKDYCGRFYEDNKQDTNE